MRKNMILAALISFMFVFSLQIVEPVSAAKLKVIDKGSVTFTNPSDNTTYVYSWKTYQRGTSYVKIAGYMYLPEYNYGTSANYYLQKIGKKKLKVSMSAYRHTTTFGTVITKLTAAQYYWRVSKPGMLALYSP